MQSDWHCRKRSPSLRDIKTRDLACFRAAFALQADVLFANARAETAEQSSFRYGQRNHAACHPSAGAITTADLERYKQKLAQGALAAGLSYYRAAIDSVTWNKPEPR